PCTELHESTRASEDSPQAPFFRATAPAARTRCLVRPEGWPRWTRVDLDALPYAVAVLISASDSTGISGRTQPSCAAMMLATACTPSEVSPPPWISAENAPTQPSARRIGATTAPRKPGRDGTICSSPVR